MSCGYDTSGKQIRKHLTWKPEKNMTEKQIAKELERQAVLFEDKCRKGLFLDGNITFAEFTEKWFADYAEKQLKAQTLARYKSFTKRVNAAIGHIKLEKLQPHHLVDFYNNLKEIGIREDVKYKIVCDFKTFLHDKNISQEKLAKECGASICSVHSLAKGVNVNYDTAVKIANYFKISLNDLFSPTGEKTLSDKTIHHYHAFISSILSTAVVWQVILSNPCERVKPPKVTRREAKYLDENGLERVLEVLENLPEDERQNALMIKVFLFTGLRRGELGGLKWEDVDFKNNTISVRRNLLYLPEKGIFENTPKTESSIRTISVSANITALIEAHKASQSQRQLELGDKWRDSSYIFTAWNGAPLHPDTISAWFRKLVRKHDLPDVSIHSLRHTAATWLLMNGLPVKAVSSRLGHANAVTTSQIYAHALQSADEKSAEIMDSVLNKKKHG